MTTLLPAIVFFLFAFPLVWAAVRDASTMTIPNWLSLALIAGFVVVQPFVFTGWAELGTHLAVGATFFLVGFGMFAFGWLGGGDAKLMAATALWLTWPDAVQYVFWTTLFGAGLAIFLLAGRRYIPVRVLTSEWAYAMFRDEKKMPYGIALAAGALMAFPKSALFMAALT